MKEATEETGRFQIDTFCGYGSVPGVEQFGVWERYEVPRLFRKPRVRWRNRFVGHSVSECESFVKKALELPRFYA